MDSDAQARQTALSNLEKVTASLDALDAVRSSLPSIIVAVASLEKENALERYKSTVRNADNSIAQLESKIDSLRDILTTLKGRPDHEVNARLLHRTRRDPYTLRQTPSDASQTGRRWRTNPYPSAAQVLSSPIELHGILVNELEKHPLLSIDTPPASETLYSLFTLSMSRVARCHVFLNVHKGGITLRRLNLLGYDEEAHPYDLSSHAVWRQASHAALEVYQHHLSLLRREGNQRYALDISLLAAILTTYSSVQSKPCSRCHRLLHPRTMLPPLARRYQEPSSHGTSAGALMAKVGIGNEQWNVYHSECLPKT